MVMRLIFLILHIFKVLGKDITENDILPYLYTGSVFLKQSFHIIDTAVLKNQYGGA